MSKMPPCSKCVWESICRDKHHVATENLEKCVYKPSRFLVKEEVESYAQQGTNPSRRVRK